MHEGDKAITVLLAGPLKRGMPVFLCLLFVSCYINHSAGNNITKQIANIIFLENEQKDRFHLINGTSHIEVERQTYAQLRR
jgi:hypothetical protein